MNYLFYSGMASLCIATFYAVYLLLFRKGIRFVHARIYLLTSLVLSLLIPLTGYKIDLGFNWPAEQKSVITVVSEAPQLIQVQPDMTVASFWERIGFSGILIFVYFTVTTLLLLRLVLSVLFLYFRFRISYKVHLPDCILLYNHGFRNTLSFFRWIFVQPGSTSEEDLEKIIAHEKIHVSQLHSADILGIELLSAVMWFNPFIWMIKNSMKLVHEYLADEGALRSGISPTVYQTILLNQVAEERLMVLSSSFNHSLIKKRITMITQSSKEGKSPFRLLSILPVAFLLFVLTAALNGVLSKEANALETDNSYIVNDAFIPTSPDLPPDTIVKKTIIKKVTKANPNDTIVIHNEEIITGDDVIVETDGKKEVMIIDIVDGKSHPVIVNAHTDTVEVVRHKKVIKDSRYKNDSVKHVKIITHGDDDIISEDKKVIIVDKVDRDSDILYIVDGEKMTDKKAIEILNPDDIKSISVIKGDEAAKYDGNHSGVIIITTKKSMK